MPWINFKDDFFNLDEFFHIWIQQDINKLFFFMGESIHSKEEIVLSPSFENKETLRHWMNNQCNDKTVIF